MATKKKKKKIAPKIIKRKAVKKRPRVLANKKPIKKKAAKKRAVAAKKIVKNAPEATSFPAQAFFKAKIKVIGIGGGGGSIVSEIGRSLHKATFVVADTDVRAFKKRQGIKYYLFGQELTHGLGTGLNTDLARQAAESEKEQISTLFDGQDIVIFIACLGGGLGSGATQVFAEAVKNLATEGGAGPITFGIFTLPFKFEGKNKHKIAMKALKDLRKSLNVSITIPNERIFKIIQENTAITDAFSTVNRSLIESLESLIDLIYNPGIINIDFADLRAILRGRGNLAFLNTAEAAGANRADKVIADILHNPLYQTNNFTTEKVLFNVAGGNNLSMLEVDKISRAISEHHEQAKIIFGISKDAALKNKIKTTLLMTGAPLHGESEVIPVPVVAPKKEKIKEPANVKKKAASIKASANRKKKAAKKKAAPPVEEVEPTLAPAFTPAFQETAASRKMSVAETEQKRAIRRTALEAKKAEELEEQKQSDQEKEWEIPAFLRKIKIK